MHTLRQPFAAAANHFLELRLDFGEAGPSTAMIALPRLQRRLRRSEGRTRARARAWSRARSQDPRCQRATSLVTRETTRRGSSGPSENGPRKGTAEASRNPEVRGWAGQRQAASSKRGGGGGGGGARAPPPPPPPPLLLLAACLWPAQPRTSGLRLASAVPFRGPFSLGPELPRLVVSLVTKLVAL